MSSTSTWSFDYSESLIDWLNHCLNSFASLSLCCLINLRINTISKMSFIINSTVSKTNLILKKLDDWDEWIMIVKTMTKRDDVEKYVNLIKIESAKSIEFDLSIFFTIKFDATNFTDLSIDEQRDLAIMREDYKKKMRKYKERIDALKNLNIFILISIDRFNLIYLRDQKTVHQKLSALKKRLASTNRVRKLEMIRKYKNLQRAFKHQQMNQWLLNWKKIYAKTKRLNLFDVQNDRCAYDFLNSLRTMNLSFVFERKTILNHEINQRKFSTSIRDLLEEFRNHLRIARTLITKKTTHEAFATLQEKSPNDETTDQKGSEKLSDRKSENRPCLCDRKHSFNECYYLIEELRSTEWKSNEEIKKKIEKILETNSRIRTTVKWARKNVKRRLKKVIEKEDDFDNESTKKKSFNDEVTLNASFAEAFAKEQISYKLINCWTLDSGTDIHVCNDSDRFQLNRITDSANQLVVDKIVYEIENYETMNIVVSELDDSINIQLLNVALMSEFFISLICLIKMMKKEIHWNIEEKRLHRKKIIFCVVESVENHWILENNLSNQKFEAFEAKSETSKSDLMITNRKWHEMLNHSRSKIIVHLAERIDEIKVNDLDSASFINRCETCVLIKTHEIMFRRLEQKESIDYSLSRIDYDLISMNEKYNENYWINHFVDFYTRMNFVYTHSRKNDAFSMIREFLKTIRIRYDQIVRFIRMNDERILEFEYRDFMKMRKIATKRFASYTSFQNDKIERSEKILMIRTRTMRIETNLSINMWSKVFKSIDYLNNRILRRALAWKTFFEALIEKKSNLTHLQSYECRAYFLKNIISRKNRLKSKTFIDYLVRYDFINIFRIWISSRMRIVRIRDVLFDKTLFYDFAKLDSRHLLIISVKETLEVIKISNNTFFEMIIEKDDETDQMIDHLEDESIESRFVKSAYQAEKAFFLHIDMKNIYLLISEMISDRDQRFNANTIDTMFLLQISLKIDEILNSVQNQSILNSSMWNESQSQSSIKSKKNKQSKVMSADAMIMNIRSRRQTYSAALTTIETLESFHAAFSIDLERSNQKKSQIPKLHRDDLFVESRYWKQMLRHRFSQKFQIAAQKKFSELKKRDTFFWVKKANQSRIFLTWVFKYKFDIDDYLKKFKTRLCVRNDLQSTDQNTYAITLTVKTFRALMIISTVFDLEIWQYDAINTFINSEIDEELYSECSNEFFRFDYCWKLNKALYELKQVSILWYRNLITILKNLKLQSISKVNCLFVNDWLILFFYVDDIMTICLKENLNRMRFFEKSLMKRFEMKVLEELKWFLEIKIIRDQANRKIWLSQDSYISKMMTKFHLEKMKISKTLLAKILRINEKAKHENPNPQRIFVFQQRVRSLNFATVIFRLDIAFATAKLAQFLKNSNSNHVVIANRVIVYLNDTKNFVIEFSEKSSEIFLCASDAAFADDELIRKSSNDYLFKLYDDSIDWRAIKQTTMTTSSIETKLLILSRIAKKTIWWRRFFESI